MSCRTDRDLITQYARTGSDKAFAELVHRQINLVYSTALRVVRNPSLAEDVTQKVFVALARNAHKLQRRPVLSGWLHETTRNLAVTLIRGEERRRQREHEAAIMRHIESTDPHPAWDQIAPHLDSALAQLRDADREAILLRYFERKTAKEIAERLGLTEEAAQKRATRALERLRSILAARGLAVAMPGLSGLLGLQAVQLAPAGLAASVIGTAAAAGAAATATSTLGFIMVSTKIKIGLAAALVASVSTPVILQHQTTARLRREVAALRQENAELKQWRLENPSSAAEPVDPRETARLQAERAELIRLRGEVSGLRAQANDLANARVRSTKAERAMQSGPDAPLVPAEDWANVGLGTPLAAFQTMTWAKANRETNVISQSVAWADENSRARIEAVFAAAPEPVRAKYESADAYVLSLFNHAPPDDSRRIVGFRVLSENIADDSASLLVEEQSADGRTRPVLMNYVRVGNEWRQALDFDGPSIAKLTSSLQAEASAQTRNP